MELSDELYTVEKIVKKRIRKGKVIKENPVRIQKIKFSKNI
jgi:hypothetical protein